MKKLFFVIFFVSNLFSYGFKSIGQQNFGIAGTGVAIKDSAWSSYYNPALVSLDGNFKFSLTMDAGQKNDNFTKLLTLNYQDFKQNNIEELKSILKNNSLNLSSTNGLIFDFNSFLGGLSIALIIDTETMGVSHSNIADKITGTNINQIKPEIDAEFKSIALIEVPIIYAYAFNFKDYGKLSIGVTTKYLNLVFADARFNLNENTSISDIFKNNVNFDFDKGISNYSFDTGIAYDYKFITLGLVGKYLNSPKFNHITIDPQARFGMSLNFGFITLASDIDLTENKLLLNPNIKEQLVTLGAIMDWRFFAIRSGFSLDLKNQENKIYSIGLGLSIFDIGVQFGQKTSPINGIKIPDYFKIQIGTGFSF